MPVGGGRGVKGPSSRSFSYTIIVPSACETRKREAEPGTHRTQVHGELEIEPYGGKGISMTEWYGLLCSAATAKAQGGDEAPVY